MQQQKIAVLVSIVDQNVVGILSHVGSAVSPNVLRLSRRIIEVITTLKSYVLSGEERDEENDKGD